MRFLLDTHTFLWWVADSPELSREARRAMRDPEAECLVSLVSCWEIAIKQGLGKLTLPSPLQDFIPFHMSANGFHQMEIEFRHITRLAELPLHHRDPFDRLLTAQVLSENLTLISADTAFDAYRVNRLW